MPIHKIIDLRNTDSDLVEILQELKRLQIIQAVANNKYLVISRWNVTLSSLMRILKEHEICLK